MQRSLISPLRHLVAGILLFTSTAPFAASPEFEFTFWPTLGAEKDRRFLRLQEGACGDLAVARVRVMPRPQSGDVLGTDMAFELNTNSRVVRQWNLPANAVPLATAGQSLIFYSGSGTYSVTPSGPSPLQPSLKAPKSRAAFRPLSEALAMRDAMSFNRSVAPRDLFSRFRARAHDQSDA
jgi:hypothetical protein